MAKRTGPKIQIQEPDGTVCKYGEQVLVSKLLPINN